MAEPTSGLRRMDFVSEVMSSDKAKGKMDMRFLPDPRPLHRNPARGKTWHFDKYLGEIVSLEEMADVT